MWPGGTQPTLLLEESHICIPNICSERFLWQDYHFGLSHYHGKHFLDFFLPMKFGQNLLSCQVSEKSTHRFDLNDGTDTQTDRHTYRHLYIYIYIYMRYNYSVMNWISRMKNPYTLFFPSPRGYLSSLKIFIENMDRQRGKCSNSQEVHVCV